MHDTHLFFSGPWRLAIGRQGSNVGALRQRKAASVPRETDARRIVLCRTGGVKQHVGFFD